MKFQRVYLDPHDWGRLSFCKVAALMDPVVLGWPQEHEQSGYRIYVVYMYWWDKYKSWCLPTGHCRYIMSLYNNSSFPKTWTIENTGEITAFFWHHRCCQCNGHGWEQFAQHKRATDLFKVAIPWWPQPVENILVYIYIYYTYTLHYIYTKSIYNGSQHTLLEDIANDLHINIFYIIYTLLHQDLQMICIYILVTFNTVM